MIGLGFRPFHAAALNLIANTAPVAWGSIGIPIHTLAAVLRSAGIGSECDHRTHPAHHGGDRAVLAGAHHGELAGDL